MRIDDQYGNYRGYGNAGFYGETDVSGGAARGVRDDSRGRIDERTPGKKNPEECQTCKNRKYKDGSDEMVSFKTPGKIAPEESYAKVMAHEQEHVANAIAEGSKPGKQLLSATVTLRMAVCPECGRSYISGGTTNTVMRTYNEDPYGKNFKSMEKEAFSGNFVDMTA